jgi:hypothetical protein
MNVNKGDKCADQSNYLKDVKVIHIQIYENRLNILIINSKYFLMKSVYTIAVLALVSSSSAIIVKQN